MREAMNPAMGAGLGPFGPWAHLGLAWNHFGPGPILTLFGPWLVWAGPVWTWARLFVPPFGPGKCFASLVALLTSALMD